MAPVAGLRPACGVHPSRSVVRVRLSSRLVCSPSGVQPVRCPVTWVRRAGSGGPAVWCPPVQRPAVWCPPVQRPALWCPAPVRPDASVSSHLRRWRWGPDGCGGATCTTGTGRGPGGCRAVRAARSTAEAWMTAGDATEVARWSVGCRRRTRPGWVRAVAAALARCPPGRPGRRAERPWLAAALWAPSRLQREVAAPVAWLPSWAVCDHGAWSWPSLPPGWADPAGPMGVTAEMGVRPQRGPGPQRAPPAPCRQRCDLRRWLVGLPGLEPGTSSLSAITRLPLCNPAFLQVTRDRKG
jgi:hypothetical protein